MTTNPLLRPHDVGLSDKIVVLRAKPHPLVQIEEDCTIDTYVQTVVLWSCYFVWLMFLVI